MAQKKQSTSKPVDEFAIEAVVEKTFERLNNQMQEQLLEQLPQMVEQSMTRTEFFSGPMPHPDIARQYEEILPGFTERTLAMAENAQQHEIRRSFRIDIFMFLHRMCASILAFIIIGAIFGAGFFLLWNDKDGTGLGTLASGVALVIAAFLQSKKPRSK